ncbi:MAG: phosphatase PAP2 family protein [Bacteroidetes bacterium]|nr:MAG: phosphatase PAP2 family protein [Bacteroidota bacterium]
MTIQAKTIFIFCALCLISYFSNAGIELPSHESDNHIRRENLFWEQFKKDSLWSLRSRKGVLPMTINNMWIQAGSPLRITEQSAWLLMLSSGITASVYYFDQDIDDAFRPLSENHKLVGDLSPKITQLGEYWGYSFLAISGVYSLAAKNHKLLHDSVLAGEAAITAGIWARVVKVMAGRMRPGATYNDREFNSDHWFGPFSEFDSELKKGRSKNAFSSFPSGHTTAAFAISSVFADRYKDRKAVPWIAYSLSGVVAVSRMVEHEHWASDLIPGALIGYACGRQVVKNYKRIFPEYREESYNRMVKKRNYTFSVIPSSFQGGITCLLVF